MNPGPSQPLEEAVREFNMAFDKAIRVGRMNMELFKAMVEFATLRGRKDIAEKLEIAWAGHPACMQTMGLRDAS